MGSSPLQNTCSCFSTNEEAQNSSENILSVPSKNFTLTRVNQVPPEDEEPFLKIMELYETIGYNTMSTGVLKSTFRVSRSLSAEAKRMKFMDFTDIKNKRIKETRSWSVADYRHRQDTQTMKSSGILKNRVNTLKKTLSHKKNNRVSFHPSLLQN